MDIDWITGVVNETGWEGTGFKFAVTFNVEGFDMDEDNWTITLKRGSKKLVFTSENSIQDDQGQWYICFDSTLLGSGSIEIIGDAEVPDDDFEGGIRHEVMKYKLINIQRV